MIFYLRIFRLNLRQTQLLKSWTKPSLSCLFSSSVRKSLSIQDIKRKALKNLNAVQEIPINTKEVVIYESTRHGFYQGVAFLSLFNYIVCVFLVNICLYWYLDYYKIKNKKYYIYLSSMSAIFGHLVLILSVLFTTRVVNYIKFIPSASGADKVRIYCYSVFGLPNNVHKHEVLIQNTSALKSRLSSKEGYIPLKVKGKILKFHIDTKGIFTQPILFDETVGVLRKL